jgi:hypothetical protein
VSWTTERARIAGLSRDRARDDPELVTAYQNLHALRLEEHIRKVLATAPRPSDEQLQRIAALLLAGRPDDAAQPVKKQKPRARRDRGAA